MGNFTNKVIGAVVVLLVVLLVIFVGGKKENTKDQNPDETLETNNGALRVVEPVVSGDYKYEFTGIKWTFDTTSPEVAGTNQTWLKMEFADFTRNGNAIAFGSPYKLGIHPGTCVESNFIDTSVEAGIPIAYAVCDGGEVKRDFVVLQENETIIVKMNEKKGAEETGWKEWYKLDVTSVVR